MGECAEAEPVMQTDAAAPTAAAPPVRGRALKCFPRYRVTRTLRPFPRQAHQPLQATEVNMSVKRRARSL